MTAHTTPDIVPLQPSRAHLNPKFDGYKLVLFDDATQLHCTALPSPGIHVPKVPPGAKLSYRELQSRVTFNHLAAAHESPSKGAAFYIDAKSTLTLLEFDRQTKQTTFHRIVSLPVLNTPLPSCVEPASATELTMQYPSIRALTPELVLVADGAGNIYLVRHTVDPDTGVKKGEIVLTTQYHGYGIEGIDPVPCVLLDAKIVKGEIPELLFAVYSVATKVEEASSSSSSTLSTQFRTPSTNHQATQTFFNITLASLPLPLPHTEKSDDPRPDATVLHVLRGPDIPCYFAIDPAGEGYVVGSEQTLELVPVPAPISTSPSSMDIDPVPPTDPATTAPPYTWRQTATDLTIDFRLPPHTTATAIHCNLTTTHLSLIVDPSTPTSPPLLSYPYRKLHHPISASASRWTLDPVLGHLTLHLEKLPPTQTRWPHVFASDDTVPESLTADEIASVRDRLARFTSDVEIDPASVLASPLHPLGTDIDDDIDDDQPRVTIAWIDRAGRTRARTGAGGHEWVCGAFERLGAGGEAEGLPSVCLKRDVDGLVYNLSHPSSSRASDAENGSSDPPLTATHVATFDALTFVQASKRERRFTRFDSGLRFACVIEAARSAYVYWRDAGGEEPRRQKRQTLVDLTRGRRGADVVGVQMVGEREVCVLVTGEVVVFEVAD